MMGRKFPKVFKVISLILMFFILGSSLFIHRISLVSLLKGSDTTLLKSTMEGVSHASFTAQNEHEVISIYLLNLMDNALSASSVCVFVAAVAMWKSINYTIGSVGTVWFTQLEWNFMNCTMEPEIINFFTINVISIYAVATFAIWVLFSTIVDAIVGVDFEILEQNITWKLVLLRFCLMNTFFFSLLSFIYIFDRLIWRVPSLLPEENPLFLASTEVDIPHVEFQYHSYDMPAGNNIEMAIYTAGAGEQGELPGDYYQAVSIQGDDYEFMA